MRIVEEELPDMPGQDAFLDVLTNMVGIIILLVVVIGIRTSRATVKAAVDEVQVAANNQDADEKEKAKSAEQAVLAAESNLKRLMQQVVNVRGETTLRDKERNYLATYVAAFEQEINQRRDALSAEQRADFDLRRKLVESQQTLENLGREQVALLAQPSEVEAIENQPTPLAHRMSGKKLILHLAAGHVTNIPEQLFLDLVTDIQSNLWRLRDAKSFISSVGPINGFRLRYQVAMIPVALAEAPYQSVPGSPNQLPMMKAELIWYEVLPEKLPIGDEVAKALEPNSELQQVLHEHPADTNTVVIIVYPDSIRELHQLKKQLYAAGYAIAEKPKPHNGRLKYVNTGRPSGDVFVQ